MEQALKLIYIPCPSLEVAKGLAQRVIEEDLVACANILPAAVSLYVWEGKLCEETECILILKTTPNRLEKLGDRLGELHPYDTPALLAIDAQSLNKNYLDWMTGAP